MVKPFNHTKPDQNPSTPPMFDGKTSISQLFMSVFHGFSLISLHSTCQQSQAEDPCSRELAHLGG
jgi:hypothetical protein